MRRHSIAIAILTALAATAVAAAVPANAQSDQPYHKRTRHVADATKRPGSRIVVTRRSYLDAGTELLPGDPRYTNYLFPTGFENYNATYRQPNDPVGATFTPLSDPFWPRW